MVERQPPAKCISVLGTGSDVGKSIVATALCRIFQEEGFSVAPFKAQNMSNNSAVTRTGGEMGRAQAVQAQACRVEPHVDMNPVLLKPNSDTGSQVVVQGKVMGDKEAGAYFQSTDYLFEYAKESLERLRRQYSLIVMEGAGSCGEVNLAGRDFVNFKMAQYAGAPVILVADIDRGGVFAQVIGTLAVIAEEDRNRVQGVIVNRFRGDRKLFDDGIQYLEERTGIPVLGLIPHYNNIQIDSEDGLRLDAIVDSCVAVDPQKINIAVIRLPHISNFTDFSPLEQDPGINLHYLQQSRSLEGYQLVLLPGSKNVRGDMAWLNRSGWRDILLQYAKKGGEIGGICGGFQMLGRLIADPTGVEGPPGEIAGLGLLEAETTLEPVKILSQSSGKWLANGERVEGYEIHMGTTILSKRLRPAIRLENASRTDGAVDARRKVWGTYLHGLFDREGFRTTLLKTIDENYRPPVGGEPSSLIAKFREEQYRKLAAHFRAHLDMRRVIEFAS